MSMHVPEKTFWASPLPHSMVECECGRGQLETRLPPPPRQHVQFVKETVTQNFILANDFKGTVVPDFLVVSPREKEPQLAF